MKTIIYLLTFILLGTGLKAQDSSQVLLDWQLNIKRHHLEISSLPKRLPKDKKRLELSYQADHSNSRDFFTLSKDSFYKRRQNAFKINKRRYSGQLLGYDKGGDLRFEIEFRNGKLDGRYIVFNTDGSKSTKVYSKGKLIADAVIIKEEK